MHNKAIFEEEKKKNLENSMKFQDVFSADNLSEMKSNPNYLNILEVEQPVIHAKFHEPIKKYQQHFAEIPYLSEKARLLESIIIPLEEWIEIKQDALEDLDENNKSYKENLLEMWKKLPQLQIYLKDYFLQSREYRNTTQGKLYALIGASGIGKSSLLLKRLLRNF